MNTNNSKTTSFWQSNFFRAAMGTIMIFGVMTFYVLEFAYLQNTFNPQRLVIGAFVVGFLVGLLLGQRVKNNFADEDERRVIAFAFPVLIGLLMPLVASVTNRSLNFKAPKNEQVEFVKMEPYGGSRIGIVENMEPGTDGYSVFFYRHKKLERIRFSSPQFENKVEGDRITLPIIKGALGFEYVNPK